MAPAAASAEAVVPTVMALLLKRTIQVYKEGGEKK